jgi:cell shape-determining protein MreD
MGKKLFLYSLTAYCLFLLQTCFLSNLGYLWQLPSLVIVFFAAINLIEKKEEKTGVLFSLPGGLILDMGSNKPLGFFVLIFLIVSLIIKLWFKRYVRLENNSKIRRL